MQPAVSALAPQIYKERKHLAFTLADAKSVVARLEFLLGVAAHAVAALLYLLIFRVGRACSIFGVLIKPIEDEGDIVAALLHLLILRVDKA